MDAPVAEHVAPVAEPIASVAEPIASDATTIASDVTMDGGLDASKLALSNHPALVGKPLRTWPAAKDTLSMEWIASNAISIGESSIKGAGKGVFAAADIPARRVLGWYRGRLLSRAELDAIYDGGRATYVLFVGKNRYVDAVEPELRNWTALMNDTHGTSLRPNCTFTHAGTVKSLRRIRAGEELFVSYGKAYWS
jgi:hypothetical protein